MQLFRLVGSKKSPKRNNRVFLMRDGVHGLFMPVVRTEWLFIEASAMVAVGVSKAFCDIVVLHRRDALAMVRGEAQGWW